MKLQRPAWLTSIDALAGILIIVLILLIGLVIFTGTQLGIRVSTNFQDGVGPFGPLRLKFSSPVVAAKVEPLLSIDPITTGRYEWPNAQTVQFIPSQPLKANTTYKLILQAGSIGQSGELLKKKQSWTLHFRSPLIAYLAASKQTTDLWVVDMNGHSPHRLMQLPYSSIEFDASPNGEFLILSVFNKQSGIDLWQVNRDGSNAHLLVGCGAGRCTTPAISPDSSQVAYTSEAAPLTPGGIPGAPRIMVFNLQTQQNRPLFADSQMIGYYPIWSPDGMKVSSYDGINGAIRVVTISTGAQVSFPTVIGTTVASWSPDSSSLLFTDIQQTPDGNRTVINQADFASGQISTLFGPHDDRDYYYDSLAWLPTGDRVLIGLRPSANSAAEALWLVNPDMQAGQMIVDQANMIFQSPHWDPWGNALVFEKLKLGGPPQTQIALWMPGFDQPRTLATGFSPHWLP